VIDIRTLGLVVALALLAVGLYRLLADLTSSRKPHRSPVARPDPPKAQPAGAAPAHPPAAHPPPGPPPAPASAARGSDPGGRGSDPGRRGSDPGVRGSDPGVARGSDPGRRGSDPGGRGSDPGVRQSDPKLRAEPPPAKPAASAGMVPSMLQEHESDEDITIITLAPPPEVRAALNALASKAAPASAKLASAPAVAHVDPPPAKIQLHGDDEEDGPASVPGAVPILYDADASVDEPTRISPLILVSAAAQTDQGRRRRRNEDSLLVLEDHHLFVVADGMGGHAGGDVASKMAVETIGQAFKSNAFGDEPYPDVPRRGAELALAIQLANKAIYDHAKANAAYTGMGTTVVSARFSPNKQRVYFGHVGDSRCYRLRGTQLTQVTTDHTMASQGVTGPLASHLNRAVGVQPAVKVDLLIARPRPDDVYLLCTDGLSKMVPDDQIQSIMNEEPDLDKAVNKLVERANARGGRDNITVILVQVKDPKGLAKYIQDHAKSSQSAG
jgi:serine/threonine protein phosphatase PrpC